MLALQIDVPYASFRKSYARSFAETYSLPPPATVYGMLLSLVGERSRSRHVGVSLAFAYKCRANLLHHEGQCMPPIATTLRKLSRFKYGSLATQTKRDTPKPDFVETLCDIDFLCWIDSTQEKAAIKDANQFGSLEQRVQTALSTPQNINRRGVLCLGLSDDAVNSIGLCDRFEGKWHRLLPSDIGSIELPVWVDHVGSANTRWRRFEFEETATSITESPGTPEWDWIEITDPRGN